MLKRTLTLLSGVLVLAAFGSITLPSPVRAQTAESDHAFKMRMQGRLRSTETTIDRIRKDLDPDGGSGKGREPGVSMSQQETGALYELDQMEDVIKKMNRELDTLSMMSAPSDYERQRQRANFEYYVDSMDRRLWEIRAELKRADKADAEAAAERAERQALEEEVSNDADWAEDWARGDD